MSERHARGRWRMRWLGMLVSSGMGWESDCWEYIHGTKSPFAACVISVCSLRKEREKERR